jgi:hypothetical protein
LFIQDKWQVGSNLTLNYGFRWDAQLMPKTVDPRTTAYGRFLDDPNFPSDGTIPDQWTMFQPRFGFAWDINGNGRSVVRGSAGVYYARQNMLSQVQSVTTNGVQQQTIFASTELAVLGLPTPTWPGVLTPAPVLAGEFPLFTGVRVFHRDYENPRVYAFNVAYEQELTADWAGFIDVTWNEGRHLTRFLNYNRSGPVCCDQGTGTGNVYLYTGVPWGPQLAEVMVTNSRGKGRYRGMTLGIRKRFSRGYQLEGNYVLAKDEDNDSNERDPFTDRSFNFFDLDKDWGPSDRDIRHKFNAFGYFAVPGGVQLNARVQYRGPQPITPTPRILNGNDRGRNSERKDNEFFSFDWRVAKDIAARGHKVRLSFSMFNSTDHGNYDAVRLNVADPRFGEVLGRRNRRFRLDFDWLF